MLSRILLFIIIPAIAIAQQKDTIALHYAAYISSENLKKHLSVIASDEYEGRETGKPGQKKAADYIASQFRSYGLTALIDSNYFQLFDVYPKNSSATTITVEKKEYRLGKDFYAFRGNWEYPFITDELVFAGYGKEEDDKSDYKGLDVKNKAVMICQAPEDTTEEMFYESVQGKIKAAKSKGAAALLIISGDFEKAAKKTSFMTVHSPLSLEKPLEQPFPVFYISPQMAGEIAGKFIPADFHKPAPGSFTVTKKIIIDYHFQASVLHSENVLGYIEGSDLKDQLIVISAHYDHLGVTDGKVYNGADDDGSGTVSVLELAQTFMQAKKNGHGPRRSLLFLTVAGEEKGLLGSAWYTSHPVFPLAGTVCDLNIDMIGRSDERHTDSADYVYTIGSAMLSPRLYEISEQCNRLYCGLRLDYTYDDPGDKNRFYYRSDHYNFAKNNIPVIFYFNGTHKDYHRETDEVDKINFPLMEKRVKLIFFTAWTIANMDEGLPLGIKQKK